MEERGVIDLTAQHFLSGTKVVTNPAHPTGSGCTCLYPPKSPFLVIA
jgi:hypothetical protein